MSYIWYLIKFQEDQPKIKAFIDSSSEINEMTLTFAAKLELKPRSPNVGAWNINSSLLETYSIVLARFWL